MNSKKWCIIALFSAISAMLAIVMLNIAVDPFGAFGSEWYAFNATNNPRVAKIEYLKKNHKKYDSYIIGCSSTSSYPVKDLNRYFNADFYNMIMYGGDMLDVEQTVKYLGDNYAVENIVVNLYISYAFDYNYEDNSLTGSTHPDVSGDSKLDFYKRFALVNPQYSFSKIAASYKNGYLADSFDVFDSETGAYDKRKRDAEHISDLDSYYEAYPVFAAYPEKTYTLPKIKESCESISNIKSYCAEKGINLIFINAPLYYDYFMSIDPVQLKEYYSEIAKITDFWDFSVSSVSLDPRYFYDETHFRNDVGSMMLARVFNNNSVYIPDDFGIYITKDNVSDAVDGFYNKAFSDESYTKKLPVLLYHHIADDIQNEMTVSVARFEEQMLALKNNGYSTVTLDDIINYINCGTELPKKPVLITFDDGYMSNFENAFPILEKYKLKGTVFSVGETFGRDTYPGTEKSIIPHFGAEEMQKMQKTEVIEVQSHTYALHQNPNYCDGDISENILIKSGENEWNYATRLKKDLSMWRQNIGEIKALAFPYGLSDLLSQAILNETDVKLTFTTTEKADTLIKGLPSSGYSLGRFTVNDGMSGNDVIALVEGQKNK